LLFTLFFISVTEVVVNLSRSISFVSSLKERVFFGGGAEGKRPHGRPRHRWEDNKNNFQKVGWGGIKWTELAQDENRWSALTNAVMNFRLL
jgi:hypothetical protein